MTHTNNLPVPLTQKSRTLNLQGLKLERLLPFVCLSMFEFASFGINMKSIGIYEDDWFSFAGLHFVPHSLPQLIRAFLFDPKKIVRPLECLNIPVLYYFAGEKPLWYHIASCGAELLGACFLYLSLARILPNRSLALIAAILFLLYPTHDYTHYGIVLWDLNVATWFFTMSVWLFLKGLDEKRFSLIIWSVLSFLVSLCNHEDYLPLVLLYPFLATLNIKAKARPAEFWKKILSAGLPLFLAAAGMLVYRCLLLPYWHLGFNYPTDLSLPHFVSVMAAGININLACDLMPFCLTMISEWLRAGPSISSWISLSSCGGLLFFCLVRDRSRTTLSFHNYSYIIIAGTIILLLSYSIFAVSRIHMPAIAGWLSRINVGGSLGASLIITGLLGLLSAAIGSNKPLLGKATIAAVTSVLAVAMAAINLQAARPWIVSWQAQKQLISFCRRHACDIKPGDSLIIGGLARYVQGVVVADCPWDIENMLQTTLNCRDLKGTVVTERLTINRDALVDAWGTDIMGVFPFKHMLLYAPDKSELLRISTGKEFIDAANKFGWKIKSCGNQ